MITIGWSHLQSASNKPLKFVYFGRVGYFNWYLAREPTERPVFTKWWKSELMLATNFGSLYPKVINFGSQNFGYQIWFCTRLWMFLSLFQLQFNSKCTITLGLYITIDWVNVLMINCFLVKCHFLGKTFSLHAEISCLAADALAPSIAMSSATMVLTMQDKQICDFHSGVHCGAVIKWSFFSQIFTKDTHPIACLLL